MEAIIALVGVLLGGGLTYFTTRQSDRRHAVQEDLRRFDDTILETATALLGRADELTKNPSDPVFANIAASYGDDWDLVVLLRLKQRYADLMGKLELLTNNGMADAAQGLLIQAAREAKKFESDPTEGRSMRYVNMRIHFAERVRDNLRIKSRE